jgi:dihydroorotase
MDAVVKGKALLDLGLMDCCIGIDDGKITRIAKVIERADRRFDFSGRLILPAGVDLHVHFREPGMTHKEDFETGSMAAAAGGVAFVLDMPNTKPLTRTPSDIEEKIKIASKKSYVDFGVAVLLDERTDIANTSKLAMAFKLYLGETTGIGRIDPGSLRELLTRTKDAGIPTFIHAEHIDPLDDTVEEDLSDHDRRRSQVMEMKAARAVLDARPADARVHLLHVTQARILEMIEDHKETTAEVTPHHLLLDKDMELGTRGKINPPLRAKATRLALWEAFSRGLNDTLGSDHSPHTIEEKEEDFDAAPSGMPGVETMIPLMLKLLADRKIDIRVLCRAVAERPAEIIGVRKGAIRPGYDADLIVVDLNKVSKIRADKLHSKCGWTAYEGWEAIFPEFVMIGGNEIARLGNITGERCGRGLRPGTES